MTNYTTRKRTEETWSQPLKVDPFPSSSALVARLHKSWPSTCYQAHRIPLHSPKLFDWPSFFHALEKVQEKRGLCRVVRNMTSYQGSFPDWFSNLIWLSHLLNTPLLVSSLFLLHSLIFLVTCPIPIPTLLNPPHPQKNNDQFLIKVPNSWICLALPCRIRSWVPAGFEFWSPTTSWLLTSYNKSATAKGSRLPQGAEHLLLCLAVISWSSSFSNSWVSALTMLPQGFCCETGLQPQAFSKIQCPQWVEVGALLGAGHLGLIMRLRGVVGGVQLIMSYVLPVLVAKRWISNVQREARALLHATWY